MRKIWHIKCYREKVQKIIALSCVNFKSDVKRQIDLVKKKFKLKIAKNSKHTSKHFLRM